MLTCILSFNHTPLTEKCVRQTLEFVEPQKILLVHNGSLTENIAHLKCEFKDIQHFVIDKNQGFTNGANRALEQAFKQANWVLFLTNDCLLLNKPEAPQNPGLFAPLIFRRSINKFDSVGAIFYPNRKKLVHIKNIQNAQKWLLKMNLTNSKSKNANSKATKLIRSVRGYFYVPGTAFYIDKSTFDKNGRFDESLHTYWEDVDYSVRAHHNGIHLGLWLQTQIIHKVGKTCHKDSFYTNTLFKKNRATISKRYGFLSSFFT